MGIFDQRPRMPWEVDPALNPAGRTDVPFQFPNWGGGPPGPPMGQSPIPPMTPDAQQSMAQAGRISDPRDAAGYRGPTMQASPAAPPPASTTAAGAGNIAGSAAAGNGQGTASWAGNIPVENAKRAVREALASSGADPFSGNFLINQLMKRATDLVTTVMARGQATNPAFLGDPQAQQAAINAAVQAALQGGNVFAGRNEGAGLLSALQAQEAKGPSGYSSPDQGIGVRALTNMLNDPEGVANLTSILRYSGMPTSLRQIAGQPLDAYGDIYAARREQGGLTAQDTALSMLLKGLVPLY